MALDNLLRQHAGVCLDVVDILGKVGKQLPLVLKQTDECVGWGELLLSWKDILRNRKEDARILTEEVNIEDFLRVAQTEMLQPGV